MKRLKRLSSSDKNVENNCYNISGVVKHGNEFFTPNTNNGNDNIRSLVEKMVIS